jgi:hypothetical protein
MLTEEDCAVVNEIGSTDAFGNSYIFGRLIDKFPYPSKSCPYCERKLVIVNAVHLIGDELHYKAVYIDGNINCPVYDKGAKVCYAKIYYSSDYAFENFHNVKFPVKRWGQENLYTYYK